MSESGGILESGSGPGAWFYAMGSTVGAIVCTGFGAYSMYWWTMAAIQRERTAWFYAIAAFTTILVAWAIAELSALRRLPRFAVDKQYQKQYRRRYAIGFNSILAIEVVAINLGGPILSHFHRPDLYPQWVDLVVGIHFFPLAKLFRMPLRYSIFRMPLYYATGLAISLSALGSLLLPPGSLRLAINAGGTGLALCVTAVIILTKNLAYLPEKNVLGAVQR